METLYPIGIQNFEKIRKGGFLYIDKTAHTLTDADVLNSLDIVSDDPIPVIYQSGYLTIKGYDPRFNTYTLGFRAGASTWCCRPTGTSTSWNSN